MNQTKHNNNNMPRKIMVTSFGRFMPIAIQLLLLLCRYAIVQAQSQQSVRVEYLAEPESEWQRGLGFSVPGDGNALFLSPDETVLYVTAEDGSLHAIQPLGGALLRSIAPPPLNRTTSSDATTITMDWTIHSRSGIAFHEQNKFLVYAITDIPPLDDFTSRVQSRVVAVRHAATNPTLLWISDPIPGEIQGTPVISSDGQRVFFTRNSIPPPDPPTLSPSISPSTLPTSPPIITGEPSIPTTGVPISTAPVSTTTVPVSTAPSITVPAAAGPTPTAAPVTNATTPNVTRGLRNLQDDAEVSLVVAYFTVMDSSDGSIIRNEVSRTLVLINHKYAPVGIARNVTKLLFSGGIVQNDTASDLILWHSSGSPDEGGGETQLYQYVTPELSDVNAALQLSSTSWVTNAPPVVTATELFFVDTGGFVQGWVDGRNFDLTPNLQVPVSGAAAVDAPLYNTDRGLLYIITSNNIVSAVSIPNRKLEWERKGSSSAVLARPVLSVDRQRLYLGIGSELYAVSPITGQDIWKSPVPNDDGSLIRADLTVSYNGQYVYYVGLQKQIVTALKVARSLEPTESPSIRPSVAPSISHQPNLPPMTRAPRTIPAMAPVNPQTPQETKSGILDNIPLLVGSIVGGVVGLILIGGLVYYLIFRNGGGLADDGIDPDYDYDSRS